MKPVNIAVLGSGFVADLFMQGLEYVPGQVVRAVWSRSLERARTFAAKWKIVEATQDLDALIQRDDIDLYLIALPNALHKEVSLKLSAAERNQVCTKPLGRNAQEARAMYEAAVRSGALHGYAETEVFAPAVVKAREVIEAGGIGQVKWIRSRESHSGPHAEHFRSRELAGGGALIDLGCHCIAAARYLIGKEVRPTRVFAWGEPPTGPDGVEENALGIVRFENGAIAHFEVSWSTKGGLDLRNEVYGTEGAVFTDVTRGSSVQAFVAGGGAYIVEKADAATGWVRPVPQEAIAFGYQGQMAHFVQCVRDGTTPRETYEDGYIVNAIMDAAYRSIASGRWEPIEYASL